jgi:hypothetical protein
MVSAHADQFRIAPEIQQDRELATTVQQATAVLRRELRRAADRVTGEWRIGRENGHRYVELLLDDEGVVSSTARFEVGQLSNEEELERRLSRFWDKMLEEKSDRLLERLRETVSQLEDE